MRTHPKTLLAALAIAAMAGLSDGHAATFTYVGTQKNIDSQADDGAASGWHSTGPAKPLDIDGDNVLGTDGWIYAKHGAGGVSDPDRSLPSYFTDTDGVGWKVLTPNATRTTSFGLMDGPTAASPGANPATAEIGFSTWWHWTGGPPNGNPADLIQFTFNSNVDSLAGRTLRVGILFDAVPQGSQEDPSRRLGTQALTITQTVGGSATATSGDLDVEDDGLDVAFFDLTGLADGDTFVINADPSSTTYAHIGAVTFDSVVIPEPGSLALLGLGSLLIAYRRRASKRERAGCVATLE